MEQNLGKLKMISYDDSLLEHRNFKREMLKDAEFQKYFGSMFLKQEREIFTSSDHIEIKKAYLVKDDIHLVGMIRLFSYHESGYVNIQYAVHPKFRKQGYGFMILKELTKFLLNNNIICIEADIDKNNIGSIKVARKLGFSLENDKYRLRR